MVDDCLSDGKALVTVIGSYEENQTMAALDNREQCPCFSRCKSQIYQEKDKTREK
jgi:hypothetical protein